MKVGTAFSLYVLVAVWVYVLPQDNALNKYPLSSTYVYLDMFLFLI
jgi:hypothetical protein